MRIIRNLFLALAISGPIFAGELCRGQSTFIFANFVPGEVDAPVFDAAGSPLFGTNYLAMLYGRPDIGSLAPATVQFSSTQVMSPEPFTFDLLGGGYFYRSYWVVIPSVPGLG